MSACSDTPTQPGKQGLSVGNAPSLSTVPGQTETIRISAQIDGQSRLILRGNTAQWFHMVYGAPGLWEGPGKAVIPTTISGAEWYPQWPSADYYNYDCGCYSSTFTNVVPVLPRVELTATLTAVDARGAVKIVEQPSASNQYALIIEFDDRGPGNAAIYTVDVTFTAPRIRVSAYIDGRSRIILRGATAQWYQIDYAAPGLWYGPGQQVIPTTINGVDWLPVWPSADYYNWFCQCYSSTFEGVVPALPASPFVATLSIVQARGPVAIVEQPSAANGYAVIVEFNDNGPGAADTYTVDIGYGARANVAPTISAGGPYAGAEGSPVNFAFSASDVDGDALTYTWDFGDGVTGSGSSLPPSHVYADDGSYQVSVSVDDGGNGSATAQAAVTVSNMDPVITTLHPLPGSAFLVGEPIEFYWSVTDPGVRDGTFADYKADYWVIDSNWGDGTSEGVGSEWDAPGCPQCVRHTYQNVGTYTATFTTHDADGGTGHSSVQVIVHRAPTASAGGPYSGIEGTPIAFSGSATDADGDAIVSYLWDFGDGTQATGANVTHAYRDNGASNPGVYPVTLTVTDARGAVSAPSRTTASVANRAPTASFQIPGSVNEGTSIVLTLAAEDAPGDVPTLGYAFDCGDGRGYGSFVSGRSQACPTRDNGTRTVKAMVRDKDGAFAEYTGTVTIVNVPPSPTLSPDSITIVAGQTLVLTGRINDPGLDDNGGYRIDWGTGGNTSAVFSNPSALITVSNRYTAAGTYQVTLSAVDKDRATGVSNVVVVTVVKR